MEGPSESNPRKRKRPEKNRAPGEGFVFVQPFGGDDESAEQNTYDEPGDLIITFFDIGQGNATLVECPGGEVIMIDCGSVTYAKREEGEAEVDVREELIQNAKVFVETRTLGRGKPLDYLILSHPDKDHVNLVSAVLADVTISCVLCGGQAQKYTDSKGNIATFLSTKKGKPVKELLINQGGFYMELPDSDPGSRLLQLPLSPGLHAWIVSANAPKASGAEIRDEIGPSGVTAIKPGTQPNTDSVVVCFEYKRNRILICGDATFSTEHQIVTSDWGKGENLCCYALEGGHHGSADSFADGFLQKVNPSWIHFSADNKGTFRHPTWEVVERVLNCCPLVKSEKSFGPHSVVVGPKNGKTVGLTVTPRLEEALSYMKDNAKSGAQALATLLGVWAEASFKKENLGAFSVVEESWIQELIWETRFCETNGDFLNHPLLKYQGERLDEIALELQHVSALQFNNDDYYWEWLVTDINLYTTLTTANLGVYWQLTFPGTGDSPRTDRL